MADGLEIDDGIARSIITRGGRSRRVSGTGSSTGIVRTWAQRAAPLYDRARDWDGLDAASGRVPDKFVELEAQADGEIVGEDPFDELAWRKSLPLSFGIVEHR